MPSEGQSCDANRRNMRHSVGHMRSPLGLRVGMKKKMAKFESHICYNGEDIFPHGNLDCKTVSFPLVFLLFCP